MFSGPLPFPSTAFLARPRAPAVRGPHPYRFSRCFHPGLEATLSLPGCGFPSTRDPLERSRPLGQLFSSIASSLPQVPLLRPSLPDVSLQPPLCGALYVSRCSSHLSGVLCLIGTRGIAYTQRLSKAGYTPERAGFLIMGCAERPRASGHCASYLYYPLPSRSRATGTAISSMYPK